jgi:competence protein ComEC
VTVFRLAPVLAAGAFVGALARPPFWVLFASAGLGLAVLPAPRRATVVVLLLTAASTSVLADAAWSGLDAPLPPGLSGRARLVTDPAEEWGATRVEMVIGGRHYDAWARGAAASELARASAGETLMIEGRASDLRSRAAPHLRRRHVAGRLDVLRASDRRPAAWPTELASRLRRTLQRGGAHLPDPARGLFEGMVLGDDRRQPASTVDAFRASGLSHLLVVSGQNVAFVLALAYPLVRRGATGWRLLRVAMVLALFGAMVRWEPSVLRAVAMAGLTMAGPGLGLEVTRGQVLAASVGVLLLLDPLLAGSVSFLLSVSASAGLAFLAPALAARLPGPRALAEALGATSGAQIAVAPILLTIFGTMPLAAVPANLLAGPMAGPAMTWGMAAGLPAGLLGPPVAQWLHKPTELMVGWVGWVADRTAGASMPHLRLPGRSAEPPAGTRLMVGGGATVVIVDRAEPGLAVRLRTAGVKRVDVLFQTGGTPRDRRCISEILGELEVRSVVAPAGAGPPRAREIDRSAQVRAGPLTLTVEPKGRGLAVKAGTAQEPR